MILDSELNNQNIIQKSYPLPLEIIELVKTENWLAIDQYFLAAERPGGALFNFMEAFLTFTKIEHIISTR